MLLSNVLNSSRTLIMQLKLIIDLIVRQTPAHIGYSSQL